MLNVGKTYLTVVDLDEYDYFSWSNGIDDGNGDDLSDADDMSNVTDNADDAETSEDAAGAISTN